MGGKLGVSSHLGIGSLFWFEVNFSDNSEESIEISEMFLEPTFNAEKVLLIIGDLDQNKVIRQHLKGWKLKPYIAKTSTKALCLSNQMAQENEKLDLIIINTQVEEIPFDQLAEITQQLIICKETPILF
jgi:hypothetical protein